MSLHLLLPYGSWVKPLKLSPHGERKPQAWEHTRGLFSLADENTLLGKKDGIIYGSRFKCFGKNEKQNGYKQEKTKQSDGFYRETGKHYRAMTEEFCKGCCFYGPLRKVCLYDVEALLGEKIDGFTVCRWNQRRIKNAKAAAKRRKEE